MPRSVGRLGRTLVTALAAVALGVATASPAAAAERPADLRSWGLTAEQSSNSALVDALATAREEYRTAVLDARSVLRATQEGVRQQVAADTADERTTARSAADALAAALAGRTSGDIERLRAANTTAQRAFRDALAAARAQTQSALDTAVAAAKSTLSAARSAYLAEVRSAFTLHASGQAIPRALLEPEWWPGLSDGSWLGADRSRSRVQP